MIVLIVIGTMPNFINMTQFKKLATNYSSLDLKIVHTVSISMIRWLKCFLSNLV
jgi:UDP-N-acetylglucosamine 2-epimerase